MKISIAEGVSIDTDKPRVSLPRVGITHPIESRGLTDQVIQGFAPGGYVYVSHTKPGEDGQTRPYFGKIDALSFENEILYADLVDVPEEIAELFRQKFFPHRSIEWDTKSGELLGVALMGSARPAADHLPDYLTKGSGDAERLFFAEPSTGIAELIPAINFKFDQVGRMATAIREYFISTGLPIEKVNEIVDPYVVSTLRDPIRYIEGKEVFMAEKSTDDIERLKKELDAARAEAEANRAAVEKMKADMREERWKGLAKAGRITIEDAEKLAAQKGIDDEGMNAVIDVLSRLSTVKRSGDGIGRMAAAPDGNKDDPGIAYLEQKRREFRGEVKNGN